MFRRALLPLLLWVVLASFMPAAPVPEVQAQPPARSALPAPAPALARPAPPVRTAPLPNVIPASLPAHAGRLAAPLQDEGDILMDNFNRLNSGYTLGQANTGQSWQNANSYQIASIVSNKAFIPGHHIETIPAAADGTLAATFVAGCNGQLIFRYRDNAHYYTVSTEGSYYKVTRRNGSYTDMVLDLSTLPYTNGDHVSVVLSGASITVLVNDALAIQLSDNGDTTAGTIGLTTGDCDATFDDISMNTSTTVPDTSTNLAVTDHFNRANASALGQADSGQTWENANSFSTGDIASNQAVIRAHNIETIPAAADGTLAVTFVDSCAGQLIFRYRDNAHYYTVSTQDSYYKVTRRNGNYTDVVLEASTVPYANGDRVSVLLAGPFIGVLVNGVLAMDLTDSVFTKASTVGLTTGNCPSTFDDITMGLRALDGRQTRGPEDCLGCGLTNVSAQVFTPWPVNTRTGNFWTHATDLAVSSPGPELVWSRAYASQAITTTTGLIGFGWQAPFTTRIITPSLEPGRVTIFSPQGNDLSYDELGNGQYQAAPGIYSTLVRAQGVFTQTLRDQRQFIFDAASGRLVAMRDSQGRSLTLDYDTSASPPRLTQITDAADTSRYLALTYTSGRISSVSDGVRSVAYQYDTAGNLVDVTDVLGHHTTYTYQNPTSHLLTAITNPLAQVVEQISYDTASPPRVTDQTLLDGRQIEYTYTVSATLVTSTGLDGRTDVQHYDYAGTNALTDITSNGQSPVNAAFDSSFTLAQFRDANGHTTTTSSTPAGLPVRQTNALGHTTRATYDSRNNLTQLTDALGVRTQYTYDTANNLLRVTSGITTTSPLRATTYYTYTYDAGYRSRLLEQRGPDGVLTRFAYDPLRPLQVISTTVGYGTPLAQTTTYGYDQLGRVVTTTLGFSTSLARSNVTRYNADNTIASTIGNYQDGVFNPAQPDTDIVTTYGYDALGRQAWVRDVLGRYDVTHYNTAGQVDWTARNLLPAQFDSYGQPLFQVYSSSAPDANVATLYGYDGLGRTTLVTETGILTGTFSTSSNLWSTWTTRVTRTEYDTLSRPITVTLNYRPDLPIGVYSDVNVQTLTYYDGAGNVIWQRDGLGRWTKTEYDAINQPVKIIRNYEDGNPLQTQAGWRDHRNADTDLISVYTYDALGRLNKQTENYVNGVFTPTEPITDRITLYQYDTLNRVVTTTVNYAPGYSGADLNRVSVTAYDPQTGRVQGRRDALGRWVSQQYNAVGQLTANVTNCRSSGGNPVSQQCASFNPLYPDRNVVTQATYDALGRANTRIDALGTVGSITYDGLGRTTATTQNAVLSGPTTPITNVTTLTSYDGLGRTIRVTDPLSATTSYGYNALGQTVVITDSMGRATHMGYDGAGTLRWVERADGQLTVYRVDGLGRTVTAIVNYQDGVALSSEYDQDLIIRTVYDAGGRRTQVVEPDGRVSEFGYDLRDLLTSVHENSAPWLGGANSCSASAPCTFYSYDRAGQRTAITDANGHVRRFEYDSAAQMIAATDALNRTTEWSYDAGGRLTLQVDARGLGAGEVQYGYDGLDRPTTIWDVQNSLPYEQEFDALGRRVFIDDLGHTTSFTYDPLGRMTAVDSSLTGEVTYEYDARGQRTELGYPGGRTHNYSYWDDGQLESVSEGSTVLASYDYDSVGRLQDITRSNGTTTSYDYDGADRLIDMHTQVGSTTRSRYQYTVNQVGLRLSAVETVATSSLTQNRSSAYTYDGLRRLTDAVVSPVATYHYAYDAAGNRTQVQVNGVTTETRSYDAANQVVGWTYDDAGNLLNGGVATFTYDGLGRMVARNQGGVTTDYTYNLDGTLVTHEISGTTTYYTQDEAAPLSQILNITAGSSSTDYLYGAERLAAVSGSTYTWFGSDALGSVRQTLNNSGSVLAAAHYDPWGTPESGTISPFAYTGELHASQVGLVYLRARWYSTGSGTFTGYRWRTDETLNTTPYSHHPYAYALGNPVLLTDPSGRCPPFLQPICGGITDAVNGVGNFFKGAHGIDRDAGWIESGFQFGMNLPGTPMGTYRMVKGVGQAGGMYMHEMLWGEKGLDDIPGDIWQAIKQPWEDIGTAWNCGDTYLLGSGVVGVGGQLVTLYGGVRWLSSLRPSSMPVRSLRFSQSKVSQAFAEGPWAGMTIDDVAAAVRDGSISLNRGLDVFTKRWWMNYIPATKYLSQSGKIYTGKFSNLQNGVTYALNNRGLTLTVASEAEMVNVNWKNIYQVWKKSYQFDTPNKGIFVEVKETGKMIRIP